MITKRGLIDIAANLTDSMYKGIYNGSQKHEPDLVSVLGRAWTQGLKRIIVTGTGLKESSEALDIVKSDKTGRLFSTVGCHPTQCGEFDTQGPDRMLQALSDLIEANRDRVVAVGECGLDYERTHFCPRETQLKYFERQLELAKAYNLPLFLHCRAAADDVAQILARHESRLSGGVVHSFDGTLDEARRFLSMGYYIGINGCSLKTEANLSVVRELPSDRLLLETDAPWCEIRPTHAGHVHVRTRPTAVKKEKWTKDQMVKGRNEPANLVQVLEVLAAIRKEPPEILESIILANTYDLFFPKSKNTLF